MTSIKIHQTANLSFLVEGHERREETIPAFALPGHVDTTTAGEQTMQLMVPVLRFAPTTEKMLELVKYRAGEGDLEDVIFGPGCQPVGMHDGAPVVTACAKKAALSKVMGGFMVTTHQALATKAISLDAMESKSGRDVARAFGAIMPAMAAAAPMAAVQVSAVRTIDEALGVLRGFFGAT